MIEWQKATWCGLWWDRTQEGDVVEKEVYIWLHDYILIFLVPAGVLDIVLENKQNFKNG